MKVLVLTFFIAILVSSIPSSFDLRVQTQLAQYTNYDLQVEGICAGYAWAKEIAQIIGNAVGLYEGERQALSAQQILDCTETETDICYKGTLENIHSAIKMLSRDGITTEVCYPNKPFSYPGKICRRECHDGKPFDFQYIVEFINYANFSDITNQLKKNEKMAMMAIIKVDEAFNYFSSFNTNLVSGGPASIYQYRVAEVVGWKDAQTSQKIILRAGPGEQWGFNGFIDLDLSKYGKYIEQLYIVQVSQSQGDQSLLIG